jgi:hypothetical protein
MIEVINPILPVSYNFSAGVKGEYLPYIVNPDGTEEFPLGKEFIPNVITNIGLDRWFTNADTSNNSSSDFILKNDLSISEARKAANSSQIGEFDGSIRFEVISMFHRIFY